jgi:hypothetical protein
MPGLERFDGTPDLSRSVLLALRARLWRPGRLPMPLKTSVKVVVKERVVFGAPHQLLNPELTQSIRAQRHPSDRQPHRLTNRLLALLAEPKTQHLEVIEDVRLD